MQSTTDRPKPPTPECPPALVGPCTGCQQPCHRYGPGGNPLCSVCTAELEAWRARVGRGKAPQT